MGFAQVVNQHIASSFSSPWIINAKIISSHPNAIVPILVSFALLNVGRLGICTFVRSRNKLESPLRLEFHYSEFEEHASS